MKLYLVRYLDKAGRAIGRLTVNAYRKGQVYSQAALNRPANAERFVIEEC